MGANEGSLCCQVSLRAKHNVLVTLYGCRKPLRRSLTELALCPQMKMVYDYSLLSEKADRGLNIFGRSTRNLRI